MLKKIILQSIAAVLLLQPVMVIAKEQTPIETFISRVKETNQFQTVADIWSVDKNFDQTEMLKNVEKAQPLTIDYMRLALFMKQKTRAISLVLPAADGNTYTVELARYDFFTNDFEVHEMGAEGREKMVEYTPGLYYRGVVSGVPGSVASFSFFNNEVYGFFSLPGQGNFVVAPNTMVGKDYDYNLHYVLYNDDDLKFKDRAPMCHADELHQQQSNSVASKTTTIQNNKVYNSCKEISFFHTADYSMYVKKGSSTTNCTNYITSLFNNNSTLYINEGVLIVLKYVQVNTATDQYQSLPNQSHRWLTKFGWVTQNVMHECDLAMLLTTKNGYMGGVAWLGSLCNPYNSWDSAGPYAFCNINNSSSLTTVAFPTYSWDVSATTHEMGHNLGSPHTHACVWNPPARNTAIDGCETIEGSCADPGNPSSTVKGTIMSYCHLISSIGISFTNGFGPQPGDTIRHKIRVSGGSCGNVYNPNVPLPVANRTVSANKECTDLTTGITYYYKDNNTAAHTDDTLVLMIKKNGNNIGDMNNSSFNVKSTTITGYGGGTAVATAFPTGTAGAATTGNNYAMRRYWSITPVGATSLSTPVDVIFPFLSTDTTDVNGSVPGATTPITNYRMFKVNGTIDPNPANNFPTATSSNITIFPNAPAASTTRWSIFPGSGSVIYADFKVSNLAGGGGAFYGYGLTSLSSVDENAGIEVFPNPTNSDWFITIKESAQPTFTFQLFSADGRTTQSYVLPTGTQNTIAGANLPAGVYFFRVINGDKVYTGNLVKN
jgi:hypothetical protein